MSGDDGYWNIRYVIYEYLEPISDHIMLQVLMFLKGHCLLGTNELN